MTKFATLILLGAAVLAVGALVAPVNAAVPGPYTAVVAINPQPLPPIDRERDEDFYDLG